MITLDTAGFIQSIFTVRLSVGPNNPNGDFASYADIIGYHTLSDDPSVQGSTPGNPIQDQVISDIFKDIGNQWNALPLYFTKGKCRDTSLGGNDAVNCYPQFNETDDVSEHPFLLTNKGDPLSGMGRVYSEVYDDQQQILYMTFGVPQFNSLTNFYSTAVIQELATLMNDGVTAGGIGHLIGSAIGAFVSLPALPMAFIGWVMNTINNVHITKYYDFKSAMPLYYRAVNSMIIHLSINMGLTKDVYMLGPNSSQTSGGNIASLTQNQQAALSLQTNDGTPTSGLPEFFDQNGFDIYRILVKKYKYAVGGLTGNETSDDALLAAGADQLVDTTSGTFAQNFITAFANQMYGASLYVGFRIEKGVDCSESFSNETGESSIAQQINSKAQEGREARFSTANGNFGGILGSFMGVVEGIVSGLGDALVGSSIKNIIAGAGVVDIPDVWKTSTFSKNYHFNMSLRSPYGDIYSILQNLYIPLALLLAGGLPRAIGNSAYTAPFVCRAYCKGMFAIPLGMINSMTVKRGADQFGWNSQRLPTCIDVSFEIKDLSPAMYLAIGDGTTASAVQDVFTANSNFQEYLMTLSGMGLSDRLSFIKNLRRKVQYLMAQKRSSKLSPFFWGAWFADTPPARMLSVFLPSTYISNK